MDDCIFCRIIKGEIPSHKIYEDEHTLAFLDISCDAEGHTLVVPKKHCRNILDCDEQTLARVAATVRKISKHYITKGFTGINIFNNNEKPANQSVFHLHFHIYPRKEMDGMNLEHDIEKKNIDLAADRERFRV